MGNIQNAKGFDKQTASKLEKSGIHSTEDFVNQCCTPEGRNKVSQQTGIDANQLKSMAQREELHDIKSLHDGQYDSLLEASGINGLHDLSQQNSTSLYNEIRNINEQRHLSKRTPSQKDVDNFVNEAKGHKSRIR